MGLSVMGLQQHFFRGQFCSVFLSNNLDAGVECIIGKFAGDTKLGGAVDV